MRIKKYQYSDGPRNGWVYSPIELGNVNLFVGESGSGKTKLLNTIFNIGSSIAQGTKAHRGEWEFVIEIDNVTYIWRYLNSNGEAIEKETLTIIKDNVEEIIVDREEDNFLFKGQSLPKLSRQSYAITLFKDEPEIAPLFLGFTYIMRRNFFSDELERAAAIGNIPNDALATLEATKDISKISIDLPLSVRLYLLQKFFPTKYQSICDIFRSIFHSVEFCDIPDLSTAHPEVKIGLSGKLPIFSIKEKGVKNLIGLMHLSSGMQKVLLLLTDIVSLPGNWVYLLDEYENSLGINAINFLPSFLIQHGGNNQFIITTHHPYLINNMPIQNWYVFNRRGSNVTIKFGEELEKRYGISKQKAFIQLINDPFYTEGTQ